MFVAFFSTHKPFRIPLMVGFLSASLSTFMFEANIILDDSVVIFWKCECALPRCLNRYAAHSDFTHSARTAEQIGKSQATCEAILPIRSSLAHRAQLGQARSLACFCHPKPTWILKEGVKGSGDVWEVPFPVLWEERLSHLAARATFGIPRREPAPSKSQDLRKNKVAPIRLKGLGAWKRKAGPQINFAKTVKQKNMISSSGRFLLTPGCPQIPRSKF